MDNENIIEQLKDIEHQKKESTQEPEGQLNVDIYQNSEHIKIVAPIAGVEIEDVNISITDDVLKISGKRKEEFLPNNNEHSITQECFWGPFSRSIVLPENIDTNNVQAHFKHGILSIVIPKLENNNKTKFISITK